jgi:hypothetical protein
MKRHRTLWLAAVLVGACGLAVASTVTGDSPTFPLDTRDAGGVSAAAVSAEFVIDTRSVGLTAAGDSSTFVLDTRGGIGLGGCSDSDTFTLDTRGGRIASLVVSGPERVSPGDSAAYSCEARYEDGSRADVSALCSWALAGDCPPGTAMFGNTLSVPSVPSAIYAYIRATYDRVDGRIVSDLFEVAIRPGMTVRLGDAVVRPGASGQWRLDIAATAAGGNGFIGYSWKLANVALDGEHGASLADYPVTGTPGSRLVAMEVSDGQGNRASASRWVPFDKPPAVNQPVVKYPAADVGLGRLLDRHGKLLEFDSSRIANGLIVLTHGLNGNGTQAWLQDMARDIELRLNEEGKPLPNIAIYDWKEGANPSSFYGGGQWWNPLSNERTLYSGASDIVALKPAALDFGRCLASDLAFEMVRKPPRIDPNAPIHLIGHSAGGFVMGECATLLKSRGRVVDRVTMLDTPMPVRRHFTDYPNPGVVEQFISSFWGFQQLTLLGILPGEYYIKEDVPNWLAIHPNPNDGHEYCHWWYHIHTVFLSDPTGFFRSPFLNGPHVDRALAVRQVAALRDPGTSAVPLDGFETFGAVALSNGVYTVTEASDAGVFQEMALPVGVQTLAFRYRFVGAGDGDFLTVHWGDYAPLYIGSDMLLAREGFISAEVDFSPFAGQTNRLVFTLVSRGATNAVLQLSDIALSVIDDPDGDGLTNAEEAVLGTDPLQADSDGDNLSDGDEGNVYHTNPLLADSDGDGAPDGLEIMAGTVPSDPESCFKIVRTDSANGGQQATITWNGKAGRTYRINCRMVLTQPGYDTIVTGIPGVEPLTSFTFELNAPPPQSGEFYWIELE